MPNLEKSWDQWPNEITETIRFRTQEDFDVFVEAYSDVITIIRSSEAQPSQRPEAERQVSRNLFDAFFEWIRADERRIEGRPSFDTVFMRTAELMAERGTCPRLKVGAVITVDNRIIATGYNGAPAGLPHCSDVGCLRQKCPDCFGVGEGFNSDGDEMYCRTCAGEGKIGGCKRTTHAEANALIQCAKFGHATDGGTLYITHRPCVACTGLAITAGIKRIIWKAPYDTDGLAGEVGEMLRAGGVKYAVYNPETSEG